MSSFAYPPLPGHENAPVVILQGHLDMVCEQNRGTDHDFARDPLKLVREDDWIRADGTTLGADNGIAVAMALALLDDKEAEHGPLEILFTVDEETGLVGAVGLEASRLSGRTMINLDTEEEDTLCIGCAGGVNTEGAVPVVREAPPEGYKTRYFSVKGLRGGHSGTEIHRGLGNALLMAMRVLKLVFENTHARLVSLEGGGKHNAIPRECFAEILIPSEDLAAAEKIISDNLAGYKADYGDIEPGITMTFEEASASGTDPLDCESCSRIIDTVYSIPHGIVEMSRVMENLVESSNQPGRG